MAKVIVLTNQKGGCGKTTTTIHLACGIARLDNEESNKKNRVLVIDADPQKTARNWATGKEEIFKFSVIALDKNQQVNKIVQREKDNYDYILVDCPPSVDSIITYSSLLVGDLAIIPLLCSANDLWALTKIVATIKDAKKHNPSLKERILINQYKPKENLTAGILAAVEDFGIIIFYSKLGSRIAFKESSAYGTTVYNLKDKKAIDEINSLTKEVLNLTK